MVLAGTVKVSVKMPPALCTCEPVVAICVDVLALESKSLSVIVYWTLLEPGTELSQLVVTLAVLMT